MKTRSFNWRVWAGFLLSLAAFLSYFFVFVRFPVTRDFPWANLLLFAEAAALLLIGVRRAFAPAEFLVDSSGTVRWVNLTENYWVRARPDQFIEAAKALP